ncbi:MAG: iron-sulfur cluster assembly scaffold protein [bacterium]|nr:iron-sulfur cluster assembly scaffold protein [bacterium]
MENLYQAILLDHYRNPRHRGVLEKPDFSSGSTNPSCGDSVSFQGCVEGDLITAVAFTGSGCVISQATASLLSEYVLNKTLSQIMMLDKDFIVSMIGMPQIGPMRIKCALLPLQALQVGIAQYQEK